MSVENFYLRKAREAAIKPGESGYFVEPGESLDPNLFNGPRIRPEVRTYVLNQLYGFLRLHFNKPESWSRVWLAGSGVSYRWSAARGNGDLDCLFGVDWIQFRKHNRAFEGLSNNESATVINNLLRDQLWPRTASTRFAGQTYELTFYVNVNTGLDIRSIHPYAAYDITSDVWSVRPSKTQPLFPKDWDNTVVGEARTANQIVSRWRKAAGEFGAAAPHSGAWTNSLTIMRMAGAQAAGMYQDIHQSRQNAFGEFGKGYSDYYNYRWQSHKKNGVVNALQVIAKLHEKSAPGLDDVHNSLIRAQLASHPGVRL